MNDEKKTKNENEREDRENLLEIPMIPICPITERRVIRSGPERWSTGAGLMIQ
jgi:hypothetical protein